jgi:triacylglycerol lipase
VAAAAVLAAFLGVYAGAAPPAAQPAPGAQPPAAASGQQPGLRKATQRERLEHLAADVAAGEDLAAVKRLQRAYGFYVDKGMWEDLAQLFTDDAVANYPAGVFIGKTSIREHLYRNVGGHGMDLGLGDGRLYNHMSLQPVVNLDPSGQSAKGRWRVIAMFGQLGGGATWAEGVYEMGYAKEGGVWKIRTLDYYSGFGAPYKTGWVGPPPAPGGSGAASAPDTSGAPGAAAAPAPGAASAPRRVLAHPPDRPRHMDCEGFPAACIAPFHYENPGHAGAAPAWRVTAQMIHRLPRATAAGLAEELSLRATRLRDEQQIENLQRVYGYYLDRAMWDQVTDLFADGGTIEMGQQGVYAGKARIRQFLRLQGPQGLATGQMNDHLQLQTLIDVAPDGKTARGRSRELAMTGTYLQAGTLSEGVYENTYVKDGGVWRIQALHFYPTVITDYEKGWGEDAQPAPGVSATLPPDRPPTEIYAIYPKAYVPPYHYRNPVSGQPPHYPAVGAPDPAIAAAALAPEAKPAVVESAKDVEATLAAVEREITRVRDYDEIENLESAYGYYLDKDLWNPLADLFARDGSIELAQRGVYRGQDHVRAFLLKVFGRGQEGPVAGRLGNHIQLQPVIDIADDGQTAKIRVRLLQQMSLGGRASWGGAIYENEAVKEDGTWRIRVDHAYNTFSAAYKGGWTKAPGLGMPGPDKGYQPDAMPTARIAMFPVVYDIPFHYANPVSGRTEVPPLRPAATRTGMPLEIAAALRDIGPRIEGPRTTALYAPLFKSEPYEGVSVARDLAYGPDERNVLDVFTPSGGGTGRPVVVFIHGGGFSRGAKHTPDSPFYDNVGVWTAHNALVGVTMNYRLAPQHTWPSGIEDLTQLVGWLKKHGAEHGGDPKRIYLWGHSAGAAHVADYLAHQAKARRDSGVAGAILTSGFYDLGTTVSVWKDYYGDDVSRYSERSSLPWLLRSRTPILVTTAELDPDSFREQTTLLMERRAAAEATNAGVAGSMTLVKIDGHSHLSELYAVGTADRSLSGPVLRFVSGQNPGTDSP